MSYLKSIILLIPFFILGCDKGIEPDPANEAAEGFQGTVFFTGVWPDSITRTHLVVFKNPLNTVEDFNAFNLAFVSLEIPYGVSEFHFSTLDSALFPINTKLAAGTYSYIAVAMQRTEIISLVRTDWFVVGLYQDDGITEPKILTIPTGTFVNNINITCDFNNPPPQPPGGTRND